jgi:pantoate kinase
MAPEPAEIIIQHTTQAPIGSGYGLSGAGALGATFALSKAFDLGLPRSKMVEIAHIAEVGCRTGLGDVGAQAIGGLVIGLEPGAPPHGEWRRIPLRQDMKIICATLAPLSTKEILENAELCARSKKFGRLAMKSLLKRPTPEGFMRASHEFSEALGLLDDELRALVKAAESAGAIGASMVMLGKAVFALVKASELERVKHAFSELVDLDAILTADFDLVGARVV